MAQQPQQQLMPPQRQRQIAATARHHLTRRMVLHQARRTARRQAGRTEAIDRIARVFAFFASLSFSSSQVFPCLEFISIALRQSRS